MELTDQFYSLDLTKNWTSSNPPWKQLTPASTVAGPKVWGHSMVLSKSSVVIWSNQASLGVFTFSLPESTWGPPVGLPTGFSNIYKLRAALDPSTGLVYVPYGMGTGENMVVYNSNTRSYLPSVPMTPAIVIAPGSYGFSSETIGESPGELSGHCMVPAYNGTKMIIFGGNHFTRGVQGSIYILDLQTLNWTKGAEADPIQRRSDMACAASGDNFVAWGGETVGLNVNTFGTPIIYNLRTNAWTTEYLLLPEPASGFTPGPSSDTTPPSASKEVTAAAIGGGAAAAVILILGTLYVYRRHRSSKGPQKLSSHSLLDQGKDLGMTAATVPPQGTAHIIDPEKEEIPPSGTAQFHYTPVATLGTQEQHYSPTSTAVYLPPPPTTPTYPIPPISSPHQDQGNNSSNLKVEKGPDVKVARNPQAHIPDFEECEPQCSDPPLTRPTSSGSSNDERLRQEIAFLKAQQEKQYEIQQQNMERLRLEQQELVELLKKQIKP
ncbi:hypothetical protein BGZ68_004337 [Mortierella alpina]|nr:hypothetical protein BGZ68_004337 [Mortierella alpina]